MSEPEDHQPTPRRAGRRVLVAVAALVLLVLGVVNVWLNAFAEEALRRPNLQLEWSSAWMLFPGRVHVRNLHLANESRLNHWLLEVDRANVRVDLLGLRSRTFTVRRARAGGASFHLRRRYPLGTHLEEVRAHVPPIDDYPLDHRGPPRTRRRKAPWKIQLENVDFRSVREVWIDQIRLRPEDGTDAEHFGRVSGTARFQARGDMTLEGVQLDLAGLQATFAGETVARDTSVRADVDLAPTPMRSLRTRAALAGLESSLEVAGEVPTLDFLHPLISRRQLDIRGGGTIEASIHLDGPEILEPSHLTVQTESLELAAAGIRGVGDGLLEARVATADAPEGGRTLDLRLDLSGLDLESTTTEALGGSAAQVALVVSGRNPSLGRPLEDLTLHLELPRFEIADLQSFQSLLPPALRLELLGGSATLTTQLDARGDAERARVELQGDDLRVRFRGIPIEGAWSLTGASSGQLESRRLDVEDLEFSFAGFMRPQGARDAATPLALDLALDRVQLLLPAPGSDRKAPQLAAQTLELQGKLNRIGWWSTTEEGLMSQLLRGEARLTGRLGIAPAGAGARLREPVEVSLEVPEITLPDLTRFQYLVPAGAQIDLESGNATATATLRVRNGRESSSFRVDAEHLEALVRGTRIVGSMRLEGKTSGTFGDQRITAQDIELEIDARTRPEDATGAEKPVRATLALDDAVLELHPGAERRLSLAEQTLELRGDIEDLGWWSTPIPGAEWLRIDGRAVLDARLRLEDSPSGRARVAAPSDVRLSLPDLDLGLGQWTSSTSGQLRAGLREGDTPSYLELDLGDTTLRREGHPTFDLPNLRVVAEGPSLRQGLDLEGVRAAVEIDPTKDLDLRDLNEYLPGDAFRFGSGQGELSGSLQLRRGTAEATLRLESQRATANLKEEAFVSDLTMHLDLESSDPGSRRFDIREGQLRLDDVLFVGVEDHAGDWWLEADIQRGWVDMKKPFTVEADVELLLRDTAPIVRMFAASRRVVRWLSRILTIRDIDGTGHLVLDEDGLRIENLLIEGKGLKVEGTLDLHHPGRALLLIELHHLRAGFEKTGEEHEVKIVRPRRWFEERMAEWSDTP